ncbi:MAG: phosphoadenosine phosphosulfate reductase family protein [Gammaproteobacteria bacterium]|nr:phosphoadenosine phosphosulfate reductase family protein [Gammaproteobacteria bacterium]
MPTKWELEQKLSLDLESKVSMTKNRIREYYNSNSGNIYVSFSGGKDSTVLLDIVRSMYPDVVAVFADTGLEYPEIREFVKTIDNVVTVRPEMSFKKVLETYGYPVHSKFTSRKIYTLNNPTPNNVATQRLYKTGIRRDGKYSSISKLNPKFLCFVNSGIKVSGKCCDIMKKKPMKNFEKESGLKPVIGTMATDSLQRRLSYLKTGCNSFGKDIMSRPMSFWTEDNVWNYIKSRELQVSEIYLMGEKRTGCMFCTFGISFDKTPNRFQRMKNTHPKLYNYCMDTLDMRRILDMIGVDY